MLLYTRVTDRDDWRRLTTTRDLGRWCIDPDCTWPASAVQADAADGGWNTEPTAYPALVHIELAPQPTLPECMQEDHLTTRDEDDM